MGNVSMTVPMLTLTVFRVLYVSAEQALICTRSPFFNSWSTRRVSLPFNIHDKSFSIVNIFLNDVDDCRDSISTNIKLPFTFNPSPKPLTLTYLSVAG